MKARHLAASAALSVALSLVLSACGGGGSPAGPSGGAGGGGTTPPVQTTTIVITSNGVDNKNIQVAVGAKVTFVNSDSSAHEMSSNPHPVHTDCPALNIGSLGPGEQRESQALTAARTCGYHDHNNPGNAALQGTILIQ